MSIQQLAPKSWDQLRAALERFETGGPTQTGYAFRGHANSAWELVPSLLRMAPASVTEPRELLDLEAAAVDEFRREAHLHLPHELLEQNPGEWNLWVLMQHYGAPTRLLDWTRSAMVALYFAVVDAPEADGVVWAALMSHFDRGRHDDLGNRVSTAIPMEHAQFREEFLSEEAPDDDLRWFQGPRRTKRIAAQQGVFSVSRAIVASHGAILENGASRPRRSASAPLAKIVVRERLKRQLLLRLRRMNITANTLFPGVDGFGRSVGEIVKIGLDRPR